MEKNRFHRHFPVKGYPLYWIIIAYIVVGWFFPVVGLIALVCMVGPVATSVWKGRYWCGNVCPRGNFFDRVLSRYSPHRPIPRFVRTVGFRTFMVCFIFAMFGIQMYFAWGDWNAMGRVFWNIIVATSVVAVVLAFVYAPRTWCSFCPMGSLSALVAPRRKVLPKPYKAVRVGEACQMKCKSCARVCPMQLTPYESRGEENGYLHPDCIKCGKCVKACPVKVMTME